MVAIINTDLNIRTLAGELITISEGYRVNVDVVYYNQSGEELAVVSDPLCLGMTIPARFLSYEFVH